MQIREIAEAAHAAGALFHTDVSQSMGKVRDPPVTLASLGAPDLVTITGHKFGCVKGVGALYVKRGVPLSKISFGAGHERGMRPGTENVMHIAALGEACAALDRYLDVDAAARLTRELHERLATLVPGLRLNGPAELGSHRLANTLNVSLPNGVRSADLLPLVAEDLALSLGSACHAGVATASAVLEAMRVPASHIYGAMRLSVGPGTTLDEVRFAAERIASAYHRINGSAPGQ
jgi:cysteine desulfurase